MHFLQAINSDISVLIVCNKTRGTIKGDKKIHPTEILLHFVHLFNGLKCKQFMHLHLHCLYSFINSE